MEMNTEVEKNKSSRQASDKLPAHLFEKVESKGKITEISRPSLSYWQDAWKRLKKDRKAIISLGMVVFILCFSLIGPFIWTVDPALQNLNMISQGPSFGQKALVIDTENEKYTTIVVDSFPAEPEEDVDTLGATSEIKFIGQPTTHSIQLQWTPVEGAYGYIIYRNIHKPEGNDDLGLPLGETEAGNIVSYVDKLNIEAREYYYTIVATDGVDEAENYLTQSTTPLLSISLTDARNIDAEIKPGDYLSLKSNPLGTDYLGRDLLARLMYGGRVSFYIGIFAPLLYILIGTLYGGISGFLGGRIDNWMMRFSDFVVALPFLLFMILFKVGFGAGPGESGINPMLVALVILQWPATARLVRGQVLQLREEGFTQAARLLGAKPFYILLRHMIPNTVGVILVTLTFAIPSAIFTEAFLSFIGMGVAPPTPSWGSMSMEGIKTMRSTPHELLFPSLFIGLTVLAFNLLGDGLRDALDSKMRSRE